MSACLSGLTIGALTLMPVFDPDVTSYTATTNNTTNTITITAEDVGAETRILNGDAVVNNGTAAKSKARAAGILNYKSNAQYDLFIYAVAAVYYDCRGTDMFAMDSNVQRMINSFVLELRGGGEDPGKEESEG